MDEVSPNSEKYIFDWSCLDTSKTNVDFLIALSPHGETGDQEKYEKYQVKPVCNSNTLSQQLLVRHRNCFEIAVLMEHFKHTSLHGHLDICNDALLEKETLPNGRQVFHSDLIFRKISTHIVQSSNLYTTKLTDTFYA